MLKVSELFIYPIKSLGGIAVTSAVVTDRGFQYDRRWMLVDSNDCFFTQRDIPQMALLQVEVTDDGLKVYHKNSKESVIIPAMPQTNEYTTVQVWSDRCRAQFVSAESDKWFSEMLSFPCRLVYMPNATRRRVDGRYASNKEITSLSDGYPFLIIGQASLDDLNKRLADPLPMNRFRTNIVFTGGEPFQEDGMSHFMINGIHFYGIKPCARCIVTTIDQDSAIKAKEPLKTLSGYRMKNNKVYFGQNLLHRGEGEIRVGDVIEIQQQQNDKSSMLNS